jgi:hypothetical protein
MAHILFVDYDKRTYDNRTAPFASGGKELPSVLENIGLGEHTHSYAGYTPLLPEHQIDFWNHLRPIGRVLEDKCDIMVIDPSGLRSSPRLYDEVLDMLSVMQTPVIVETLDDPAPIRERGIMYANKVYPREMAGLVKHITSKA